MSDEAFIAGVKDEIDIPDGSGYSPDIPIPANTIQTAIEQSDTHHEYAVVASDGDIRFATSDNVKELFWEAVASRKALGPEKSSFNVILMELS